MAIRTPGLQPRSQYGSYWGVYATAALLPNASGAPLAAANFALEAGDVAFVTGGTLYVCTAPGTAGGGDAAWSALGGSSPTVLTTGQRSVLPGDDGATVDTPQGLVVLSVFGGATARAVNPTSVVFLERQIRTSNQTATVVNSTAGKRVARMFSLGVSTRGQAVFGLLGSGIADMRVMVGFIDSGSAMLTLGQQPSAAAVPAGVYLALDSTDANLQLMHKATGIAATKINLGASFARAVNMTVRLTLTTSPGQVEYAVERLDAAGSASGTINANLPTNGALLAWIWMSACSTAGTAASVDTVAFTLDTDVE